VQSSQERDLHASQGNVFKPQLMIPRGTPEGKLLRKAGIMSIVEKGGPVSPDDPITVMLPPEPHQRLVVV